MKKLVRAVYTDEASLSSLSVSTYLCGILFLEMGIIPLPLPHHISDIVCFRFVEDSYPLSRSVEYTPVYSFFMFKASRELDKSEFAHYFSMEAFGGLVKAGLFL